MGLLASKEDMLVGLENVWVEGTSSIPMPNLLGPFHVIHTVHDNLLDEKLSYTSEVRPLDQIPIFLLDFL